MPIISTQIATGVDDGWISIDNPFYDNNDSEMHVGHNPSGWDLSCWMRFANVQVPPGATIKKAFLQVTAGGDRGATVNTRIYGNDVANAVAPTDLTEYSALALTTAFTTWDGVSVQYPFGGGQPITSPDISAVIQEIVDLSGWAKGNALQLIWKKNGGNQYYSVWQYDRSASKAAILVIEYGTGYIWIERRYFHIIDADGVERVHVAGNQIVTYAGVVVTNRGDVVYN